MPRLPSGAVIRNNASPYRARQGNVNVVKVALASSGCALSCGSTDLRSPTTTNVILSSGSVARAAEVIWVGVTASARGT